jgi:hypothetical protein
VRHQKAHKKSIGATASEHRAVGAGQQYSTMMKAGMAKRKITDAERNGTAGPIVASRRRDGARTAAVDPCGQLRGPEPADQEDRKGGAQPRPQRPPGR